MSGPWEPGGVGVGGGKEAMPAPTLFDQDEDIEEQKKSGEEIHQNPLGNFMA